MSVYKWKTDRHGRLLPGSLGLNVLNIGERSGIFGPVEFLETTRMQKQNYMVFCLTFDSFVVMCFGFDISNVCLVEKTHVGLGVWKVFL